MTTKIPKVMRKILNFLLFLCGLVGDVVTASSFDMLNFFTFPSYTYEVFLLYKLENHAKA